MDFFEKWLQILGPKSVDPLWTSDKPRRIVVIGSGIGGLASAALLAKAGHQVTIFEKRPTIGGHGRCPNVEGLIFSMGPQYVWNFMPGAIGARFLECVGMKDDHPFLPMNPDGFETLFLGDAGGGGSWGYHPIKVAVPMGIDAFRDMLITQHPKYGVKIAGFFNDVKVIYHCYRQCVAMSPEAPSFFSQTYNYVTRFPLPMIDKAMLFRMVFWTLEHLFDHHGIPPMVRRLLYGHGGIFAENESDLSALAYVVATVNYHAGSRFPQYGFQHFFNGLRQSIESSRGHIYTSTQVTALGLQGTRITHVTTSEGSSHPCDVVISDIAPRLTYMLLRPRATRDPYRYSPSRGVIGYLVGIKGKHDAIAAMRGRNYWWQRGDNEVDYTPDLSRPPQMLYINSPTANGFGNTRENQTDDNLMVFSPGHYHVERAIYQKGAPYVEEFKQRKADEMLGIIDRNILPGIKRQVRFVKVITVVDTARELGCEWGSAYGRRMDVQHVLRGVVDPKNMPHNLFNVSAAAGGAGIATGVETAAALARRLSSVRL